jgi:hypothetical protein
MPVDASWASDPSRRRLVWDRSQLFPASEMRPWLMRMVSGRDMGGVSLPGRSPSSPPAAMRGLRLWRLRDRCRQRDRDLHPCRRVYAEAARSSSLLCPQGAAWRRRATWPAPSEMEQAVDVRGWRRNSPVAQLSVGVGESVGFRSDPIAELIGGPASLPRPRVVGTGAGLRPGTCF